ncbi:efflux RND transporter periplasmic adaptor subunit [Acidisphaera sp. S103]|uniref:efflux RND transporter periplasmic adaptor subunit n=1 Tax=Acidisphaera sp. S103 TaxID=1747223 RepID=UPI002110D99C|nr:efflux RND transporter periplasmic adaptor subunit [Acidisphaera sp. S103]
MLVKTKFVRRFIRRVGCGAAFCFVAGAPVIAGAQPVPQDSRVPVTVTKAVRQDVPIWLRGLGTVQANYAVQLRPRVDGTLTQVPVKEGQGVKQGDLLAVIDPRPYQAALDTAVAKKQQDQAQLSNAQADLARYASLVRKDFASRQQLDTQQALVKQFSAAILGDDAQIEAAQLNLSFCYITSPFDGRVGLRNVDPGNIVHSAEATPIISVTQIQPITVTFTLPQDNLPAIMQAMAKHTLDVVVYASDNTTELDRGVLLTPDNTIDITTGTIKLKATFANAHDTLWPGQFVNARLLLGTDTNVIAVAAPTVQHGPNGLFVYQLAQDNTVKVQPIQVVRQEGDVYVVSNGLADGTIVVATGQSRLQAGTRVSVREAQATPAASTKSGS